MSSTRRTFILTAAGVGGAFAVADWALVQDALAHAARAVAQQPPPPFTTLTPAEARDIDAMAQRIMPTTDTPGAKEAGVIHFIDKAIGVHDPEMLPAVRKGLVDLGARVRRKKKGVTSFAALPIADQDALLRDIEQTDLFSAIRFMTMVGMFADPSYGGNRGGIGWKLIGFEPKAQHQPPFGYYDAPVARGGKA
jgi:gluconate 2-dehydrogenase gamma chain